MTITPALASLLVITSSLPIGAAAGVFRAHRTARGANESLSLTVDHPTRALFHERETIRVDVRAYVTCLDARVSLESAYLEHFERQNGFTFENTAELGLLNPGDSRRLEIELTPDQPFGAAGTIRAWCNGKPPVEHRLETFVFP